MAEADTDRSPGLGAPLSHTLRVRYGECDAQRIVFNAHYLAWFDMSITELWRAACGSYDAMVQRGVDVVVAEARLSFLRPARFDEELRLEIAMETLGTTSLPSRHRVWRAEELLVEGALRHVMVDAATLRKTPIPQWLRDALAPWTVQAAAASPSPFTSPSPSPSPDQTPPPRA